MPMTKPGKFDSKGAWDGFRGEIWQEEINVRDFIQNMMEMKVFWQVRLREPRNYGTMYRSCRKKRDRKAVSWSAKQKLFPV